MKSKYKHVYPIKISGKYNWWSGQVWDKERQVNRQKIFKNERDCALWVDKLLLQLNRQPVNILKRV
jgi:hypothetical protein